MRTRLVLAEKELPHEAREERLDDKSDELLRLSPYGKVPLLVDGDVVIPESAIINDYLDEAYPRVPLMPDDPHDRARVRLWTHFIGTDLVPALTRVRRGTDPEVVAENWPILRGHLERIERHLVARRDEGPWFFGARLTLADINAVPFILRTTWIEEADVLPDYPALHAWYGAFRARPSLRETAPPRPGG